MVDKSTSTPGVPLYLKVFFVRENRMATDPKTRTWTLVLSYDCIFKRPDEMASKKFAFVSVVPSEWTMSISSAKTVASLLVSPLNTASL